MPEANGFAPPPDADLTGYSAPTAADGLARVLADVRPD